MKEKKVMVLTNTCSKRRTVLKYGEQQERPVKVKEPVLYQHLVSLVLVDLSCLIKDVSQITGDRFDGKEISDAVVIAEYLVLTAFLSTEILLNTSCAFQEAPPYGDFSHLIGEDGEFLGGRVQDCWNMGDDSMWKDGKRLQWGLAMTNRFEMGTAGVLGARCQPRPRKERSLTSFERLWENMPAHN
nr:hypothetical protein Iba_chr07dCG10490 [Ipomoea batatas]